MNFGWVGIFFVDFVDCYYDWYVGGLCVVDGFDCLWYYFIVSGDY